MAEEAKVVHESSISYEWPCPPDILSCNIACHYSRDSILRKLQGKWIVKERKDQHERELNVHFWTGKHLSLDAFPERI